ncbi:MAG: hypothetical protein ABR606_17220 [Vicinamibacterales bacterium]
MRRAAMVLATVALAVTAAGCDEQLSDLTGPTPNLEPTLTSIQREIFNTTDSSGRVACTQCHNTAGAQFAAGLNLVEGQSFQNLVGRNSVNKAGAVRVIPGNPDGSYLLHKLEGRSDIVGQRMPRTGGPFLTDGQIAVIRRWIERGAPND